jgi:hypothetical protein
MTSVEPTSLALVRRTGVVYALLDPRPEKYGRIRYVGKTEKTLNERLRLHIAKAVRGGGRPIFNWIRKLMSLGLVPHAMVLEACPVEQLYEVEWRHIAVFRAIYSDLLNLCDKGPGSSGYGHKHSQEAKEKIREAMMGRKVSPLSREKIRLALLGRTFSPETIKKMRKAQLGGERTLEMRQKLSRANLGKKISSEAIEKSRRANLGRKRSPETRERIRKANLGRRVNQETRTKMSQSQRARRNVERMTRSTDTHAPTDTSSVVNYTA